MQTIKTEGLIFIVLAVIIFFILIAVFVIAITVIYQRKKMNYINEKKMMEAAFKQELLTAQIEIQEQTFKTISQEIHDNIGQVLSLAKLNLGSLEGMENDVHRLKIDTTKQMVSKALVDLRNLSRSMYGQQLQEVGLKQTIAHELSILENTGKFKTALTVTGEPYNLEPQKEIIIYRMVQEAINNSIKHAEASLIDIKIDYGKTIFSLVISDDGNGFDLKNNEANKPGMGLSSMKNRAAMIGGTFNVYTKEEEGTSITFTLINKG